MTIKTTPLGLYYDADTAELHTFEHHKMVKVADCELKIHFVLNLNVMAENVLRNSCVYNVFCDSFSHTANTYSSSAFSQRNGTHAYC